MELSIKLNKRFANDMGLNIKVYHEPYFTERLNQLADVMDLRKIKDWYEEYKEVFTDEFDSNEKKFLNAIEDLKAKMIKSIQNSNSYKAFNMSNPYPVENKYNLPRTDVFKQHNAGKKMLSIDLSKANFNVLKLYDKEIVCGCDYYPQLVQKFMEKEDYYSYKFARYIKNSKYFRQYIFGKLNSKKQQQMQHVVMNKIIEELIELNICKPSDIINKTHDEIIIDLERIGVFGRTELDRHKENWERKLNVDIKAVQFELVQIDIFNHFYKRDLSNDKIVEIKGVNGNFLPQVLRVIQGKDITENDKVFYSEGLLSKFIQNYDEVRI